MQPKQEERRHEFIKLHNIISGRGNVACSGGKIHSAGIRTLSF
jgi:hypothetical protein